MKTNTMGLQYRILFNCLLLEIRPTVKGLKAEPGKLMKNGPSYCTVHYIQHYRT